MAPWKNPSVVADPIGTDDLLRASRAAAESGRAAAPQPARVIEAERDYIKQRRMHYGIDASADYAGLALSGGGIRSATFALGVMQTLARAGLLKRMDYLSTVSGGGYIGSALSWLLGGPNGRAGFGLDAGDFPFGIDPGNDSTPEQAAMLNWLRQNGKYLSPGGGIGLLSGIAIVLRGIALNVIVWVPICIAFFWLLLRGTEALATRVAGSVGSAWLSPGPAKAYAILSELSSRPDFAPVDKTEIWETESGVIMVGLGIASASVAVFLAASLVYSVVTILPKRRATSWRYRVRRIFEIAAPVLLWPAVVALVIASLPYVDAAITQWIDESGGPIAALVGMAAGLWSFLQVRGTVAPETPKVVPAIGAGLILYGVALFAFQLALNLPTAYGDVPAIYKWLFGLALVTGTLVNINYISIHRFYRDRLMEAYLPPLGQEGPPRRAGKSIAANSAVLQSIQGIGNAKGPCHLINTNIVLVNSPDKRRRLRGGDSFVLSALHCGSNATGWVPADSFLGGGMTLATAMSISGAAANPHAGSGGVGMTRSRSVSLLMALLNLRLGYWIANPTFLRFKRPPNHFSPGLMQAFGRHHETAAFIELSDGGHFENLGIYELVRRKVRLIIACDAAADPCFGFADLNSVRRRIAADFGARLAFDAGHDPQQLVPRRLKQAAPDGAGYAIEADMAERGFLLGRIEYADHSEGRLIYLKTTMVDSLGFGVKAYKGAHHDFPDQTTADQFFDEEQFDAYLELGRDLAALMLKDEEAVKLLLRFATDSCSAYGMVADIPYSHRRTDQIAEIADPEVRERVERMRHFLEDRSLNLLDEFNDEELCLVARLMPDSEFAGNALEFLRAGGSNHKADLFTAHMEPWHRRDLRL